MFNWFIKKHSVLTLQYKTKDCGNNYNQKPIFNIVDQKFILYNFSLRLFFSFLKNYSIKLDYNV